MNAHRRAEAKRARRKHRIQTGGRNRRDVQLTAAQRTTRDLITEWLFFGRLNAQSRRHWRVKRVLAEIQHAAQQEMRKAA